MPASHLLSPIAMEQSNQPLNYDPYYSLGVAGYPSPGAAPFSSNTLYGSH
jgi:hypothetical protein